MEFFFWFVSLTDVGCEIVVNGVVDVYTFGNSCVFFILNRSNKEKLNVPFFYEIAYDDGTNRKPFYSMSFFQFTCFGTKISL